MSADHDRTFVRTFLAVLGVLFAFTFVIIIIARLIMSATQPAEMLPEQRERVERRAQPVFEVVTDPAQAQQVERAGGDAEDTGEPKSGEEVYNSTCSTCHQAGVAGAPKTSDTAAWQQRLDDHGKD
jgi:cytochrome c5